MGPQKEKAAIGNLRNKEMDSCKASRVFNVPQITLSVVLKTWQKSSSETVKQNWVGSKFFIVKQKMIWLSTAF